MYLCVSKSQLVDCVRGDSPQCERQGVTEKRIEKTRDNFDRSVIQYHSFYLEICLLDSPDFRIAHYSFRKAHMGVEVWELA